MWSDQLEERSLTAPSPSTAVTGSSTFMLRRVDVGGPGARGGGGVLLSRHLSFLAGVLSLDSAAVTAHGAAAPARLLLRAGRRRRRRRGRRLAADADRMQ